ncbi:hypothetical protein AB0B86_26165 [Micromonospora sp. NPDC049047]
MLRFETIPMHQKTKLIQLADILMLIGDNDLEWSLVDFHGVGQAPRGMTMPDFEDLVRSSFLGYRMKWHDLDEFAHSLDQTMECLIIAATSLEEITEQQLRVDDFSGCSFVVEALDSTEWRLGSMNDSDIHNFRRLQVSS